ncbi:interferon-induced protein 44 [Danio aesculapii]|uniref:interferon-induced protein 44 n=1 Tax=Danio aesculapii TaxID=1142201 RepID=UPI0024BFB3F8|nr:interferon-induced protein 44 [Danio aesculapii]
MGSSQSQTKKQQSSPELQTPWRLFDWRQNEALRKWLENFTLSVPNVKDIKILVVGPSGAGKSSFINSINSVFQRRISSKALVNSAEGGNSNRFTQKLKGFTIKNGKTSLPFVFYDIMGLEYEEFHGSKTDDIIKAVFGHVKDGYKFNEEQSIDYKDLHYTRDPSLSDQCFCVVYVLDGNIVQYTDGRLIKKMNVIRKSISDKGIAQVVVMTKVDEACPLVKKDLRKVYTSKKIKEKMELCSANTGVPMSNIFPVKNYHDEIDTNDNVDVLILKALEQIVYNANDRLEDNETY